MGLSPIFTWASDEEKMSLARFHVRIDETVTRTIVLITGAHTLLTWTTAIL